MIKAYYILREDLDMSPAKLAVQVGHGTDLIHLRHHKSPYYQHWLNGGDRRKIVLKIKSLDTLQSLVASLSTDNIPCDLIEDSGYTEFQGKTLTGIVVYPIPDEEVPKRIQRLRLY